MFPCGAIRIREETVAAVSAVCERLAALELELTVANDLVAVNAREHSSADRAEFARFEFDFDACANRINILDQVLLKVDNASVGAERPYVGGTIGRYFAVYVVLNSME